MARENIFELLSTRWNNKADLERLNKLFDEETIISCNDMFHYTLKDFVESYCFDDWKNRGRYIDVDDYLEALDYEGLLLSAADDIDCFLTVIEIVYNFYYMAHLRIMTYPDFNIHTSFNILHNNLDACLAHYNYTISYFSDKEKAIVTEKDPAATAAVEISDPETAYEIIQYNHHSLKGDIIKKKKILLRLASELESKRSALNGINKTFSDDIFTLLNNLNLRHNNCDPHSKEYKPYVAEMLEETLEEWYDELYQMILLAKLELDHLDRKSKIGELKTHF